VEFVDGAGQRVHNATLTSANNTSGDEFVPPVLVNATAGNWTIRLTFTEFTGKVGVTVGVAPSASTNATATNETAAPASASDAGGIPALPLGLVVVGLFGVALVRRRLR
jgi:hypothetical protein